MGKNNLVVNSNLGAACTTGGCLSAEGRRRARRPLRRILAVVAGLGLLAGLLAWIGLDALLSEFLALGWVLPILLALGLVKHALRAWAWKLALAAEQVPLRFRDVLGVRLRAQAMAYVSGMGLLVSEPLKPWLLRKTTSIEKTVPATMAEAGIYWFTSLLVASAGALAALDLMADPENVRILMPICLFISGALLWLLLKKKPLLGALTVFLRRRERLGEKWLKGLDKAAVLEQQSRSFRRRYPGVAFNMLAAGLMVQLVMGAEVWLVLSATGSATSILLVLAIEASSRIVKMMSFYIPARIGADEAGGAGSFLLLGLNPATGLALALARRLQGLLWTAVGLSWFTAGPAAVQKAPPARQEHYQGKVDSSCRL